MLRKSLLYSLSDGLKVQLLIKYLISIAIINLIDQMKTLHLASISYLTWDVIVLLAGARCKNLKSIVASNGRGLCPAVDCDRLMMMAVLRTIAVHL